MRGDAASRVVMVIFGTNCGFGLVEIIFYSDACTIGRVLMRPFYCAIFKLMDVFLKVLREVVRYIT